jgi:hypothetical protein
MPPVTTDVIFPTNVPSAIHPFEQLRSPAFSGHDTPHRLAGKITFLLRLRVAATMTIFPP